MAHVAPREFDADAMPNLIAATSEATDALSTLSMDGSPRSQPPTGTRTAHEPWSNFQYLPTEVFSIRRLPPFDVVAKCMTTFFKCTGTLFFVLRELEAMEMLRVVYSKDKAGATPVTLAQLMLIAAVGSQYMDTIPAVLQAAMFNTGKLALDKGCFDQKGQELYRARTAALVGIFLVSEKTLLSREYLNQAIFIAQSQNLDRNVKSPELGERDWLCWKRLWRTCIFFDRWLASLVGYLPAEINEDDPVFSLTSGEIPYCDMETRLQGELVKVSVLMADLLKDVYSDSSDEIPFAVIAKHSERLQLWHENLPAFMSLSQIHSSKDQSLRSAVRFTHCIFLSANILLTRNAFTAKVAGKEKTIDGGCSSMKETIEECELMLARCADACIRACKELADLIYLMLHDGNVSRKCWMLIHSSFNSCLILLLNAASGDRLIPLTPEDAMPIDKCFYILEYCAQGDIVARRELETLRHFRSELETEFQSRSDRTRRSTDLPRNDSSSSGSTVTSDTTTTSSDSNDSTTVATLLTTVKTPFGGEQSLLPPANLESAAAPSMKAPSISVSLLAEKGFNWRFVNPVLPGRSSTIVISVSTPYTSPNTRKRRLESETMEGSPESWRAPVRLKSLQEYREFFKRV